MARSNKTEAELETALLDAHANDDRVRLVNLYAGAAYMHEQQSEHDAACFYLTQAMVYALETGSDAYPDLRDRLAKYGREHPLHDD